MTNKQYLVTVFSTLALAGSASADKAEPKPDTKKLATTPAPELAALTKFYVGTWHCEGSTTPAPGLGKTFASKGNVTWALALDGFWMGGSSEGEQRAC